MVLDHENMNVSVHVCALMHGVEREDRRLKILTCLSQKQLYPLGFIHSRGLQLIVWDLEGCKVYNISLYAMNFIV